MGIKKLDKVELIVLQRNAEKIIDELIEHRENDKQHRPLSVFDLKQFRDDVGRMVAELLLLRDSSESGFAK